MQTFLEQRLEEHPERLKCINHYIFTDSDIAVVGNLGHIFKKYHDFHLALTFRNNKDQPLNSGFIAVKGTSNGILRAKAFLKEVLEIYSTKYTPEAFSGDINGKLVLFLPCLIYNWTPPEGAGQFHGMRLDVQVVHFLKGSEEAVNVGILELIQLNLKLIRHAMPHLRKWKNQEDYTRTLLLLPPSLALSSAKQTPSLLLLLTFISFFSSLAFALLFLSSSSTTQSLARYFLSVLRRN
ncbi:hypothetical protein J5N97_025684 [Dioscorea zingiberensis]|uniref:Uncharacterized protein n=1 Tax=Dioscorea zingiberensis TaxID=325984 RepID=A0A9D5H5V6_9LILI|nr:hypothetical protein J5N97_025684 [Dioscorea zingiberensis]